MKTSTKALIAGALLLGTFALGRYTVPVKVVTEIKTVEVEKKSKDTVTNTDRDKHKVTTVTEVTAPDGTKTVTTKIVEDTNTDRSSHSQEQSQTDTATDNTTTIVKSSSRLSIHALGGIPIDLSGTSVTPVYGGLISKDIVGPLSIGVWGLSSKVGGVSIGLSF